MSVETPACTALVAKPARRLWPEKPAGSTPAAATRSFDNERHGLPGEPLGGDAAVPVDRPEDGAGFDLRNGKPAVEGKHGAVPGPAEGDADLTPRPFLVSLRASEGDYEPLPNALDVVAVEAHNLGSPEPARETDQEQRPVARVLHPLAHRIQDQEQVLTQERLRLTLRDPARALDAPHGGANDFRPAGVGQSPRLVRL